MRLRSRAHIPQRRRIFIGCEGESERSYVTFLGRLLQAGGKHVHLDVVPLNGGDPLSIVTRAGQEHRERLRRRDPYSLRAIFLDEDTRPQIPRRADQAIRLAEELDMHLIWQNPCHEALLLHHLGGFEQARPPTAALAMEALVRQWPEYRKGLAAARLAERLDELAVRRAASVEPELRAFLVLIWPELDL